MIYQHLKMALPNKFTSGQGQQIATYNYVDVISGTGIVELFGGETSGSYVLADKAFYSDQISYFVLVTPAGFLTPVSDLDYDVAINRPIIINGEIIVTATSSWNSGGGGATAQEYITAEAVIVHADASTTSLGTGQSSYATDSGASSNKTRAMKIAVTNYLIKAGETFRITIKQYINKTAGSDPVTAGWGHDPKDRNDDNPEGAGVVGDAWTTQMIVLLPIKIDLP